jgi:hypothetical protein
VITSSASTPVGRKLSSVERAISSADVRALTLCDGLTAETVLGSLEEVEDYAALGSCNRRLRADTAVQRELVLRLPSILWRLPR